VLARVQQVLLLPVKLLHLAANKPALAAVTAAPNNSSSSRSRLSSSQQVRVQLQQQTWVSRCLAAAQAPQTRQQQLLLSRL
jgi:hypothetical protein